MSSAGLHGEDPGDQSSGLRSPPGGVGGVELAVDWGDVHAVQSELGDLDFGRKLSTWPSRLGSVRVTFAARKWNWLNIGQTAGTLGRRLSDVGLPVIGGVASRSDFWQVQSALDLNAARRRLAPAANDEVDQRERYIFSIELEKAHDDLTDQDREFFSHRLFHHQPNAIGRSHLGRALIVLAEGHDLFGTTGTGAKAGSGIREHEVIVGMRVCRQRDWAREIADSPDGLLMPPMPTSRRNAY